MDATAGRFRVVRLGLFVAAIGALAACDSNKTRIVVGGSVLQPSVMPFASNFVLTQIQPQLLQRQRALTFFCPALPPLTTTFHIVVQQPRVDVFLNQVTLQFIDGTGVGGTPIPFPTGDLNRLFGHTFVRANTSRTFPFTQGFGCFPVSPRLLSAHIVFVDGNGMPQETTLTANIE